MIFKFLVSLVYCDNYQLIKAQVLDVIQWNYTHFFTKLFIITDLIFCFTSLNHKYRCQHHLSLQVS
jgi:hypothetical protein